MRDIGRGDDARFAGIGVFASGAGTTLAVRRARVERAGLLGVAAAT